MKPGKQRELTGVDSSNYRNTAYNFIITLAGILAKVLFIKEIISVQRAG